MNLKLLSVAALFASSISSVYAFPTVGDYANFDIMVYQKAEDGTEMSRKITLRQDVISIDYAKDQLLVMSTMTKPSGTTFDVEEKSIGEAQEQMLSVSRCDKLNEQLTGNYELTSSEKLSRFFKRFKKSYRTAERELQATFAESHGSAKSELKALGMALVQTCHSHQEGKDKDGALIKIDNYAAKVPFGSLASVLTSGDIRIETTLTSYLDQ